jgi:hypothetical protein
MEIQTLYYPNAVGLGFPANDRGRRQIWAANQRECGQVGAGDATMGGDGGAGEMDRGAVVDGGARLCESSLVSPTESGWKRQANMTRTDPFP